jgi:hypothetical protein
MGFLSEELGYLCGCLVRFRVERDSIICDSLNRDVASFVGLNFGNTSCVALVQFRLLYIKLMFALLLSFMSIDLLV